MRIRLRDLIILFLIITLAGNYVYYLFKNIYEEETKIDKNLYEIISEEPDVLVGIRETNHWQKNSESKLFLQNYLANEIPQLYLNLFSQQPVNNLLIGFYPNGTICYLETTHEKAKNLRMQMESLLNTYPPKIITNKGVQVYYYADAFNRFAGCLYYKGFWISSYSKTLLDETISLLLDEQKKDYQPEIPETHSSFNLLIPSNQLMGTQTGIDIVTRKHNQKWLSSDIYFNDDTMSFVFNLPNIKENKDSISVQITDSLRHKICNYLQISQDSLRSNYRIDHNGLFISLDYPIQ